MTAPPVTSAQPAAPSKAREDPRRPDHASPKQPDRVDPKSAPDLNPKNLEIFSTKERPAFRVIEGGAFSTKQAPEVVTQQALINSDSRTWKRLGGGKVYAPELHAVNPSGKRKIGRKLRTGFEILRRANCVECGAERRLDAGYISATQLLELEKETHETQIGILRNILRKRQRSIDGRLHNLRCPECDARRESGGLYVA